MKGKGREPSEWKTKWKIAQEPRKWGRKGKARYTGLKTTKKRRWLQGANYSENEPRKDESGAVSGKRTGEAREVEVKKKNRLGTQ